jgi:hypothetical protein
LEGQRSPWDQLHLTSEKRQGRKHTSADAFSRRPCEEEYSHFHNIEQRADRLKGRVVTAAAADGWDRKVLRREQLDDDELRQVLKVAEAGQRPEWRDTSDRGTITKLLGPMEVASSKGRRGEALLGVS